MLRVASRRLRHLVLTFLVCYGSSASGEELDARQVVRDAQSGQRRLAEAEVRQAVWVCEQGAVLNGQSTGSVRQTVKRHGNAILGQMHTGVVCKTPDYFFAVDRSKVTGRWTLIKYHKSGAEGAWRQQIDKLHLVYHPLTGQREEFTTGTMLADPNFDPRAARRTAPERVELDFRYQLPETISASKTQIEGTLTFAPDMDWVVVKWVAHAATTPLGYPVDSVLTREVQRVGEAVRVESVKLEYTNANTKAALNSRLYKYTYPPVGEVNPEEFTLDHYQIQPPTDDVYEDRGFNWPLWGGIGVGCLALSVLLAWYVRRKRRAT